MERTTLGKSGIEVSRIASGTWQLGGDWGATDEAAAAAAIQKAFDQGVTLFDTAQGYGFGRSERVLATALRGIPRDRVVLATKGGLRPTADGLVRDSSASWIRQGVEESLTALGTDYIDLYQLHWPDPATPFHETAEALAEQVTAGKIRHVGVSNFDVDQMEQFSVTLPIETIQPPYHLFRRDIEASILPYTRAHRIGVLVYGPLAHGLLSGSLTPNHIFAPEDWRAKSPAFRGDAYRRNLGVVDRLRELAEGELNTGLPQLAVAWALANPAVDVAIVGTRDPRHVEETIQAVRLQLSPEILQHIDKIMVDALPVAGPTPESV